MPKLKLAIPHRLDSREAKLKLQKNLETVLSKRLGDDFIMIDESWLGLTADISFMLKGYPLSMCLKVKPGEIQLDGKIPLAALPFQKQIKKDLLEIGQTALSQGTEST